MARGRSDGPGYFWQLLEFFGMTWPGHREKRVEIAPRCSACGNPATRVGTDWRCKHHPQAQLTAGT